MTTRVLRFAAAAILCACGPSSSPAADAGDAATGPVAAATFYVAPNGNDAWSGTLSAPNASATDGPFAHLSAARGAVEAAVAKNLQGAVVVQVRQGTYYLADDPGLQKTGGTLTLTSADSGTATTPVVWESFPGDASPIISGGLAVTGWHPDTSIQGAWAATLPPGTQPFDQLWVDDSRRFRPRAPVTSKTGYFTNMGPVYVSSPTGCTNPNYTSGYSPALMVQSNQYQCYDRFYFSPGDIQPGWAGLADPTHPVQIVDFEDWTIARLPLMRVDTTAQPYPIAYLTGATDAAPTFFGFLPGHHYLVENLVDALTSNPQPGVWYVNTTTSSLVYVPAAGEDFTSAPPTVVAPQLGQLVSAQNLAHVTFHGLTFEHANWAVGPLGFATTDGGESVGSVSADGKTRQPGVPAALSFSGAANVVLEGCTIAHSAGWGVEFLGVSTFNQVEGSLLTDLGAGGVRIGSAPAKTDTDATVPSHNSIHDTTIAGIDRVVPGNGVWIGNSHDNVIDHDELYDFYAYGIVVGHSLDWDQMPGDVTHDNQITYCKIHDIGQGVTSDLGFVHLAVSLQTGNVVSHNVFHDLSADPNGYGGWGIYLDQGSSFVTVMYNLVYDTSHEGFQYNGSIPNHGTWSNPSGAPVSPVKYNVFAYGAQASIHRNGDDGAVDFDFEHNVVYWDTNSSKPVSPQNNMWTCSAGAMTQCYLFGSNHYYSTQDPGALAWVFVGASSTYAKPFTGWMSAGEDVGSTFTVDPGFVDAAHHDFAFKSGAPAGDSDPGWAAYADTLSGAGLATSTLTPPCDASAPTGLCYVPAFPTQPLASY